MPRKAIVGILVVVATGGGVWYFYRHVEHMPIAEIIKDPRAYDGKVPAIAGEVKDRMSLLGIKYFTLKDETGEIKVVTKRVLPSVGSRVRVRGRVEEAFAIGDLQMVVFIEESTDQKE